MTPPFPMVTDDKNGSKPLSPVQLTAVELVAEGHRDTEIAKILNVARTSVNTWRNHLAPFQEAVETARREIHGKARERLESISLKALTTLEKAVEGGDISASLGIVRAYVSLVKPEDTTSSPSDSVTILTTAIDPEAGREYIQNRQEVPRASLGKGFKGNVMTIRINYNSEDNHGED